jgi:primosomal protein N' (replication factor Y) (superfamily II helicase)
MFVKIALAVPGTEPFDYHVPTALTPTLCPGVRVLVPFGSRCMIGTVVEITVASELEAIKDVLAIADQEPVFSAWMLRFTRWIAEYYLCSWGETLEAALPGALKPKIRQQIEVVWTSVGSVTLSETDRNWLMAIDGQPIETVKKRADFSLFRTFLAKATRQQLIRYQYQLSAVTPNFPTADWITIEPKGTESTRTGSRSDRLLQFIRQTGGISRSVLLSQFPDAAGSLRYLLRKGSVRTTAIPAPTPTAADVTAGFLTLHAEQSAALEHLRTAITEHSYQTFVLHGVTGSGKTEVYLHAVRETIQQGRTVLILIPEISLTPQVLSRFRERFGDRVAVLHSGMTVGERGREWWKIKQCRCDIVIGARSAVFAPLDRIGLVVVDEEHDPSYKQQETPYYHARDVAVKIGSEWKAVVILGSATPSLESWFNASSDKYSLLSLPTRVNRKPLPRFEVIDLKREKRQPGAFYLSRYLVSRLRENLEQRKQALIFLNRRGYAAFLACTACELPVLCQHCAIALTWHRTEKRLICHHCGYRQRYPESCPSCGADALKLDGIGTQRVERDIGWLFPGAGFLRLDRDTIRKRGAMESSIATINRQEVDFIIGTQLISKGHDFKHIGIVCMILADMSLNIPDFRSSERTFQLIAQVAGRAGRDEAGIGSALLQTYNPSHYAIEKAIDNDVRGFLEAELAQRQTLDNPPFYKQILFRISGEKSESVEETAQKLSTCLRERNIDNICQVLGPVPAPIVKVANRYYWQILVKSQRIGATKALIRGLFRGENRFRATGAIRISLDVDPYSMV